MTRPIRLLLLALALACGGALATALPAGAHTGSGAANPGNDGAHPWPTDRCSWSPDTIRGVHSFGHACVHHDGCYRGYPRQGRPTGWVSRRTCDARFLADMQASCRWQHGARLTTTWSGRRCTTFAAAYHRTVRVVAARAYKGPWPT